MKDAFVGVDVAFAKRKRLPISICNREDGALVPLPLRRLEAAPPRGSGNVAALSASTVADFTAQAADYIEMACSHFGVVARRIGIDAPSAPRPGDRPRRAAEVAMDRAGISCFTTPSEADFDRIRGKVRRHLDTGGAENRLPHANQLWMLVGFGLFAALQRVAPCLEVFPQATVRALGSGDVSKLKAGGVEAQLAAATHWTGWSGGIDDLRDTCHAPLHDCLDAYLSAWVASLESSDRTAYGDPPDDVIWVPQLPASQADSVETKPPSGPPPTPTQVGGDPHVRLCPACRDFTFQRWPWGWDSHSAFRCGGVAGETPMERKAEFRALFLRPTAGNA